MSKFKNSIYISLLLLVSMLALWALPALLKKATYTPQKYPFVYYSSVLEELCFVDYSNKKMPMTDKKGIQYGMDVFDSLMPLLNSRQLMTDNRLPDSIGGEKITPPILRANSFVFRYGAAQLESLDFGLYLLYESMPKRLGLELPGDVFRIKDRIEFIDMESNSIDKEKSLRFQKLMEKRSYSFPTQWAVGNMNIRKPYDEGYFCLDAKGDLFHLKMVNGQPYFRNTKLSEQIEITSFAMLEVANRRFYGFLFGKKGDVYIVEAAEGGYRALQLDIEPVDLQTSQMMIMGNLLYWTVAVETPNGKDYFALRNKDLKRVDECRVERKEGSWEKISKYIFPFYLSFKEKNSDLISPKLHFTSLLAFGFNFLLALSFIAFFAKGRKKKILSLLYLSLTGIAGLIALLVLPYKKF